MRHFLAGILNCATPLVAALPAIFLVPSGLSDFAVIISSGLPGHSIPAERNDIFSPGAELNRLSSIAPDLIVDQASMSFSAEPVEVVPRSPGSTVASSDPEQPKEPRLVSRLMHKTAFLLNSRLIQIWGKLVIRPAEVLGRPCRRNCRSSRLFARDGEPRIHHDAAKPGSRD